MVLEKPEQCAASPSPPAPRHEFADVRRDMVRVEWDTSSTVVDSWRMCDNFTLEGVCYDLFCPAFKSKVYCNPFINREHGANFTWTLGDETRVKITCPACGSRIIPLSAGFFNCLFRVSGRLASAPMGAENVVQPLISRQWTEAPKTHLTTWDISSPHSSALEMGKDAATTNATVMWSELKFYFCENPPRTTTTTKTS